MPRSSETLQPQPIEQNRRGGQVLALACPSEGENTARLYQCLIVLIWHSCAVEPLLLYSEVLPNFHVLRLPQYRLDRWIQKIMNNSSRSSVNQHAGTSLLTEPHQRVFNEDFDAVSDLYPKYVVHPLDNVRIHPTLGCCPRSLDC